MPTPHAAGSIAIKEVRAILGWKWLLFALETGTAPLLAPSAWSSPAFQVIAGAWLAHALALTALARRRPGLAHDPWAAYGSLALDLSVLASLVSLSGDPRTLYLFLFPAHVLWLAVMRPFLRDIALCLLLGLLAYSLALAGLEPVGALLTDAGQWIAFFFVGALIVGPLYRLRLLLDHYEEARAAHLEAQASAHRLARDNALLQELSFTDPLTGLFNKRYLEQRLSEEIERASANGQPVALIMMDLDYFKQYNDTYGHVRGDELLQATAGILREHCRAGDIICRYGGEEFAVVLPGAGSEPAAGAAERLRRAVEQHPFPGRETQPRGRVTASLGVAVYPTDAAGAAELLEAADRALYRAKDAGRNAVVLHSSLAACVGPELVEAEEAFIALTNVVQSLLSLAQVKDHYTFGHSERVAQYAAAIAKRLGLDEREVRRIRYAALAHDLGNAGVAPGILLKPSPLTEEERLALQQHTLLGVSLIEPFGDLRDLIPIVASHHERWDGRGYPGGLAGESIPLGARILTVADGFDAMRQHRPYRPALSVEAAAAQLKAGAGTQYDPRVVQAFLEVLAEGGHLEPSEK